MKRYNGWSILGLGLVSAACSVKEAPEARNNGRADNEPSGDSTPNAFPAEPSPGTSQYSMEAPAPAAAPPPAHAELEEGSSAGADRAAPKSAGRGSAPRDESRSRRALEPDPARPGLGTTWGETRTSRVSSSPFERASRNPFELQSISYNDANGIDAMLRGGSFAAFQPDRPALDNGMLSVRVLDDNGSPLPTYFGSGRALVAGEHGQRYTHQIANRTANRFEAVVTVDGLDVIDGQPGSFEKRGYLVQPFDSVEIDGFRQSMDDVAAFRFGSVRGSYAAKKGNDRNVGVIGVAFFAERGAEAPWTQREIDRRNSADPFPGRFAAPPIAR